MTSLIAGPGTGMVSHGERASVVMILHCLGHRLSKSHLSASDGANRATTVRSDHSAPTTRFGSGLPSLARCCSGRRRRGIHRPSKSKSTLQQWPFDDPGRAPTLNCQARPVAVPSSQVVIGAQSIEGASDSGQWIMVLTVWVVSRSSGTTSFSTLE